MRQPASFFFSLKSVSQYVFVFSVRDTQWAALILTFLFSLISGVLSANNHTGDILLPDPFFTAGKKPGLMGVGGFFPDDEQGGGGRGGGSPLSAIIIVLGNGRSTLARPATGAGSQESSQEKNPVQPLLTRSYHRSQEPSSGSADDSPPPGDTPPEPGESELDIMTDLIQQADALMAELQGEVIFIVDKDDTIVPDKDDNQQRLRPLFKEFVERWRAQGKLKLIMVTRGVVTVARRQLIADDLLPQPDYVISLPSITLNRGVQVHSREGIELTGLFPPGFGHQDLLIHDRGIVFRRSFTHMVYDFIRDLEHRLQQHLGRETLPAGTIVSCEDTCHPVTVRFSPDFDLKGHEAEIRQAVFENVGPMAIVSFDFEDQEMILKALDTKGEIIRQFAGALGLQHSPVIVAGDRSDDISMMNPAETGLERSRGVVVANAKKEVKQAARDKLAGAIISPHHCLLGAFHGFVEQLKIIIKEQKSPDGQHGSI